GRGGRGSGGLRWGLPGIGGELRVIADGAGTGEGRIVLARIVGELCVIADAAAAGEARIVLPRIVAAAGEARIIQPRIIGEGGDNAAQRLTFGDVELVARTDDDYPRAKLARTLISYFHPRLACSPSRNDLR